MSEILVHSTFNLTSYRIVLIFVSRCQIEMGFESKCSILNGKESYIEKSILNIVDLEIFPLIMSHTYFLLLLISFDSCHKDYVVRIGDNSF